MMNRKKLYTLQRRGMMNCTTSLKSIDNEDVKENSNQFNVGVKHAKKLEKEPNAVNTKPNYTNQKMSSITMSYTKTNVIVIKRKKKNKKLKKLTTKNNICILALEPF